jgi:hypothetical protein
MATRPLPKEPKSEPKKPQIVEKPRTNDWTKPAAMAIPKEGYFAIEKGRYGPGVEVQLGPARVSDVTKCALYKLQIIS